MASAFPTNRCNKKKKMKKDCFACQEGGPDPEFCYDNYECAQLDVQEDKSKCSSFPYKKIWCKCPFTVEDNEDQSIFGVSKPMETKKDPKKKPKKKKPKKKKGPEIPEDATETMYHATSASTCDAIQKQIKSQGRVNNILRVGEEGLIGSGVYLAHSAPAAVKKTEEGSKKVPHPDCMITVKVKLGNHGTLNSYTDLPEKYAKLVSKPKVFAKAFTKYAVGTKKWDSLTIMDPGVAYQSALAKQPETVVYNPNNVYISDITTPISAHAEYDDESEYDFSAYSDYDNDYDFSADSDYDNGYDFDAQNDFIFEPEYGQHFAEYHQYPQHVKQYLYDNNHMGYDNNMNNDYGYSLAAVLSSVLISIFCVTVIACICCIIGGGIGYFVNKINNKNKSAEYKKLSRDHYDDINEEI